MIRHEHDEVATTPASDPAWTPATPATPAPDPLAARMPSGGLISTILGQTPGPVGDEGARAALRTLKRRATTPADASESQRDAERISLLLTLAETQPGPARARLLTQAAELQLQRGERERATESYERAVGADPDHKIAALQLRRARLKRREHAAAADLFERQAATTGDGRERGLALCAAAELAAQLERPRSERIALLQRATTAMPDSWLAHALLAREEQRAGRLRDFAKTLERAAQLAVFSDAADTRALLALEAGRSYERLGRSDAAKRCFQAAHAADAGALGPVLGFVRLQNARADRKALVDSVHELAALGAEDDKWRAEWTRQRGLLWLDCLDDAGRALSVLRPLEAAPAPAGLRALMRAAAAGGDRAEHERVFEAWVRASGGALRNVVPSEAADGLGAAGADQPKTAAGARVALRRAALLCGTSGSARDERGLLAAVPAHEPAFLCADVIGFDVAGEIGEIAQLGEALGRDALRWAGTMRAGPLFAALDLSADDPRAPHRAKPWEALMRLAHGQPVVTRYLAARCQEPEQSARLWLAEAIAAYGDQAAYAATNAGRYLEIAGLDATEAYADALDAVRGYLPAAFGLELSARASGDLNALERVHRELADRTPSQRERSARQVRLGLLNADSDPAAAAQWLSVASQGTHDDPVLDELAIRLAMDQSPTRRALLLEAAAKRQTSAGYARAMRLQAAHAHEDAEQWDEAIRLYRALLTSDPADVFVECSLLGVLARSGRWNTLADELDTRVGRGQDPAQRAALLEELAYVEHARGRADRARQLFEQLVETNRGRRAIPGLRFLQRQALEAGHDARVMQWSLELADAVEDPEARAAELRLSLRACRRLGEDPALALLSAEGRVRELWYARELEALALRSGDRVRLYEALSMSSQLVREQSAIECAAYALRAAEVFEAVAPARAARELSDALLAGHEHPLAVEQLARLYKTAGDTLAAARTFEIAARSTAAPKRAATLHYTAALLFHDELDQPEQAIENLRLTARIDLLFGDTFGRLQQLFHKAGRRHDELRLLEARLLLPAESRLAQEWAWQRYALSLELDELDGAKATLSSLLAASYGTLTPASRARALTALAELQERTADYAGAAASLLELRELHGTTRDTEQQGRVLLQLSALYEQRLSDNERAESSLLSALELLPGDLGVLEALVWLYARNARGDAALRIADQLVARARQQADREHALVQRALVLEQLGQRRAAMDQLEEARKTLPTSMALWRTHGQMLERQAEPTELAAHWSRAAEAFRRAVVDDPGDVQRWLALCELLRAQDAPAAAQLVGRVAHALGLEHPELPSEAPAGLGASALRDPILNRLGPRGTMGPLRVLLCELEYALHAHLPFGAACEPIDESLAAPLAQELRSAVNVEELYLMRSEGTQCVPLSTSPLRLCIGTGWFARASSSERSFGLTRALAIAQFDLALIARSSPERLGLVLRALRRLADGSPAAPASSEEARLLAELGKRIAAHQLIRAQLLFAELPATEEVNASELIEQAFDAGTRVALARSGDVQAALSSLLRMSGRDPERLTVREKLALCRSEPALRGLLGFAVSALYAEIQQQAAAALETQ